MKKELIILWLMNTCNMIILAHIANILETTGLDHPRLFLFN